MYEEQGPKCNIWILKGALSGVTQFSATESPLKVMNNAFYFTLKSLFILKIFIFLPRLFGHAEERLHHKDQGNFKIYDVATWEPNNCKTHIAQHLKK